MQELMKPNSSDRDYAQRMYERQKNALRLRRSLRSKSASEMMKRRKLTPKQMEATKRLMSLLKNYKPN